MQVRFLLSLLTGSMFDGYQYIQQLYTAPSSAFYPVFDFLGARGQSQVNPKRGIETRVRVPSPPPSRVVVGRLSLMPITPFYSLYPAPTWGAC